MNRHCTMEELLAVRDNDASAAATAHLADCDACQRELHAIRQRAAALRALPMRRPPRDRWPIVRDQVLADRRRAARIRMGWASLAVAAGLVLAIGVRGLEPSAEVVTDDRPAARVAAELTGLQQRSSQLEAALHEYGPDGRILSGRAASIIADLEDRIAAVDANIAQVNAWRGDDQRLINLWRDRVQLMDALVSTHVTRTAYIGF